jgi:hypothetical protein
MKPINVLLVGFLVVATAAAPLYAQSFALDRGNILLDGQASFTSASLGFDDENRFKQFVFNPSVQYVLIPGLAVGGEVIFVYSSDENNSATTAGIGPTLTYFFGSGERRLYPFISGTVTLVRSSFGGNSNEESASETGYRGSGGVLLMLSRSVGLTGEVFYQGTNDSVNSNAYGLAFGIAAFLFRAE